MPSIPPRMQLVSDTGESTIKMFEKEVKVAKADTKKADTKEVTPEDLEELLFDDGKGAGKLEGFKSVGNGVLCREGFLSTALVLLLP